VGVFLVTAAAATVAVVTASLLILTGRPGSETDLLGAAVAQVSAGKPGIKLEQERQQVIRQDAATEAFTVTSTPKISSAPPLQSSTGAGGNLPPLGPPPSPSTVQAIAYALLPDYGFSDDQWTCLNLLWQEESNWNPEAENASGAYGIPQALPGSKMASAGPDWQTDPTTQIKWGLGYIQSVYGDPCNAWAHEQADGWY
jgi:Transglycosylase SLT domain